MARIWIVSSIPVPPATPTVTRFGTDSEAARASYIAQITALGAPADKIQDDTNAVLTERTTLRYTDPGTGTRVVLTTVRA